MDPQSNGPSEPSIQMALSDTTAELLMAKAAALAYRDLAQQALHDLADVRHTLARAEQRLIDQQKQLRALLAMPAESHD